MVRRRASAGGWFPRFLDAAKRGTALSRLSRFLQLGTSEKRLLVEAAVVVPIVRIGLTILPFRIVNRWIATVTGRMRRSRETTSGNPERITWAVKVVASRVPRATCLTQALAGTLLLVRRGYSPTMRVGVAKNDDGTLRAHAWLEWEGRQILGAPAPDTFVAFPSTPLAVMPPRKEGAHEP